MPTTLEMPLPPPPSPASPRPRGRKSVEPLNSKPAPIDELESKKTTSAGSMKSRELKVAVAPAFDGLERFETLLFY